MLRHYLNKRGYSCQVVDFCHEFNGPKIIELVKKFITDDTLCIGLSSSFWPIIYTDFGKHRLDPEVKSGVGIPLNIRNAILGIKKFAPHVKIILGGAQAKNIVERLDIVDAVFIDESEDVFPEYLDYLSGKGTKPFSTINPITGKETFHKPTTKTYDISLCDFSWVDRDCVQRGETLPLETARGCIFKCKFCQYTHLGKKKFDYLKSTETIHQHLVDNWTKYGVSNYNMIDDTFNDSEYKVDGFTSMSSSLPFELNYNAYIRADLCYSFPGMAEKLYQSGIRACFFGIESLHPDASKLVGKGWSGQHAHAYIPELQKNIWQDNVAVHVSLIAGIPGETDESLLRTLNWVNENNLRAKFHPLHLKRNPDAGSSEFERNAWQYGFKFDQNGTWFNGDWNYKRASEMAAHLDKNRATRKLHSFQAMSARTLGFTYSEILSKTMFEIIDHNPSFPELKQRFLDNYVSKLLSVSNQ
jgi:hypothetical protein